MSTRKVYHVTPAGEKGWQVKAEDAKRPSSSHDKKDEAVTRAKELAKRQKLGQVIVHKKDGTIQTEYTYGADPNPPVQPLITSLSGRSKARMTAPAIIAMPAIIRKNIDFSMPLQKLPSQPAMRLPVKLVASHRPISIDTMRAGATFDTSERPIGER